MTTGYNSSGQCQCQDQVYDRVISSNTTSLAPSYTAILTTRSQHTGTYFPIVRWYVAITLHCCSQLGLFLVCQSSIGGCTIMSSIFSSNISLIIRIAVTLTTQNNCTTLHHVPPSVEREKGDKTEPLDFKYLESRI